MFTTNNKPECNKREELESKRGQREYVRQVLNAGGIEAWEAKEYSNLEIMYTEQIIELEQEIAEYEKNWEGFQC